MPLLPSQRLMSNCLTSQILAWKSNLQRGKPEKLEKSQPNSPMCYINLTYYYIEDITRWRENMKFIFEWKKYYTSECNERVKSFFHQKINFICSSQRVIFFLLHRCECFENKKKTRRKTKEKQRNDVSDIFTSEDMQNISLLYLM